MRRTCGQICRTCTDRVGVGSAPSSPIRRLWFGREWTRRGLESHALNEMQSLVHTDSDHHVVSQNLFGWKKGRKLENVTRPGQIGFWLSKSLLTLTKISTLLSPMRYLPSATWIIGNCEGHLQWFRSSTTLRGREQRRKCEFWCNQEVAFLQRKSARRRF